MFVARASFLVPSLGLPGEVAPAEPEKEGAVPDEERFPFAET